MAYDEHDGSEQAGTRPWDAQRAADEDGNWGEPENREQQPSSPADQWFGDGMIPPPPPYAHPANATPGPGPLAPAPPDEAPPALSDQQPPVPEGLPRTPQPPSENGHSAPLPPGIVPPASDPAAPAPGGMEPAQPHDRGDTETRYVEDTGHPAESHGAAAEPWYPAPPAEPDATEPPMPPRVTNDDVPEPERLPPLEQPPHEPGRSHDTGPPPAALWHGGSSSGAARPTSRPQPSWTRQVQHARPPAPPETQPPGPAPEPSHHEWTQDSAPEAPPSPPPPEPSHHELAQHSAPEAPPPGPAPEPPHPEPPQGPAQPPHPPQAWPRQPQHAPPAAPPGPPPPGQQPGWGPPAAPSGPQQAGFPPQYAQPHGGDQGFQYHAHLPAEQQELGAPLPAENAEALDAETLVRGRRQPRSAGWRKAVRTASLGLVKPGESAAEMRRRDMAARARTHVAGGHHRVAVLSLKGGVGKTTTTVALGNTLASQRGDRVLAVDANPDRGTLSDKVRLETAATIRDLLNEKQLISRYADIRGFTSQSASRLEILASDRDPAVSEAFSESDYREVSRLLEHFYSICITDCGTGLLHSAMRGVLGLADQVVLVSSASVDGARSASATLDWLEAHEYGYLVRGAVVVLSMVRARGRSSVDLDRLEQHFAGRCRAVLRIPWDQHLEEGAEVDLERLSPPTRNAYLELAATVGEAFAWPR